jgi:predicted DNA-binding protein (UPF0278 family)
MTENDDDLFRYLERDMQSDRATEIVKELRAWYRKYMTEFGPVSAEAKVKAVMDSQPDTDPLFANVLAQIQVAADGILTSVAIHLARAQRS